MIHETISKTRLPKITDPEPKHLEIVEEDEGTWVQTVNIADALTMLVTPKNYKTLQVIALLSPIAFSAAQKGSLQKLPPTSRLLGVWLNLMD